MESTSYKDDPLFWKLHGIQDTYWSEYIATRPVYSEDFFQQIYAYHSEHSSCFDTAIDIGAGPGQGALGLLSKFSHVVASDNDRVSIEFGQRYLAHIPGERLSWKFTTGEDVLQHYHAGSMDMVTVAECFPLMDSAKILNNFHELLKPSGTLAVWFYGRAHFAAPDTGVQSAGKDGTPQFDRDTCQAILDRIMDCNFRPIVSGGNAERTKRWKRAADGMTSWLDYVPFDDEIWTDVRRHKWNRHFTLPFFGPDACDFGIEPKSAITTSEKCTEEHDEQFWEREWDTSGVRRFVQASFPKPNNVRGGEEEMERLFIELEAAMGGATVKRKFSWPVVLILASKKFSA